MAFDETHELTKQQPVVGVFKVDLGRAIFQGLQTSTIHSKVITAVAAQPPTRDSLASAFSLSRDHINTRREHTQQHRKHHNLLLAAKKSPLSVGDGAVSDAGKWVL